MNYLFIIPRTLWKVFFIVNFIIGLIFLYPVFKVLLSKKKWFPYAFKLMRVWAHWIAYVPGVIPHITWLADKHNLPQPCVYCANHTSYLDIVMSYITVPNYFVFIGKRELDKAPLFRIFFKEMNILVNRKSTTDAHRSYLRLAQDIDSGNGVFLFPEGTISHSGVLRSFKKGAFRLAIEKQVPIVPVTFLNNWKRLQNGGFFKVHGSPGFSNIIVHEPISTIGMNDSDSLSLHDKVYNTIAKDLNQPTINSTIIK